jgi:hypothetical protein
LTNWKKDDAVMNKNLVLLSLLLSLCAFPGAVAHGRENQICESHGAVSQAAIWRLEEGKIQIEQGLLKVTLDPATLETTLGNKDKPGELVSISAPVFERSDFVVAKDEPAIRYADVGLTIAFGLEHGVLTITAFAQEPQALQWPSVRMAKDGTALIWPHFEGYYVPLNDDLWHDYLLSGEWNTLESLYMPFWGVETGGTLLTYIVENPFHNEIAFSDDGGDTVRMDLEHVFPDNGALDQPISFRIYLDYDASPITPAKHFREFLIAQDAFVTLEEKMRTAPRVSRLVGAPHAYIWDGAAITMTDVHEDDWNTLAQTILEQSLSQDPTPGRRIKQTMLSDPEGDWSWDALEEMAGSENSPRYLKRAMAWGLSKVLLSPDFFDQATWPVETLPEDLRGVVARDAPSQYELHRLNAHLFYASFADYVNEPSTWGNGVSTRMIDALSESGMDRFLLVSDLDEWTGFNIRPHVASYAEEKGYLFGTYDSYHSIHDPGTAGTDLSWYTAQFDAELYEKGGIQKPNGESYWGFNKIGYLLSPIVARPYVEQRITENFANVPYSYYFIDCDATGEYHDDYHPDRMTSQSDDAKARVDRIRWIFETFRVPVGSEGGNYLFADVLSVAEGVFLPVIGFGDPDMNDKDSPYFVGRAYPGDEPAIFFSRVPLKERYVHLFIAPRYRLPLYEAVFHDSVVTSAHYGSHSFKFTNVAQTVALTEILYQVAPMYHMNLRTFDDTKTQIARHVAVFSKTHAYSYQYALQDFEFVTDERDVQKTRFGNLEIVANFREVDFDYHGKTIPAGSLLVTFEDAGDLFVYAPSYSNVSFSADTGSSLAFVLLPSALVLIVVGALLYIRRRNASS